MRRLSWPLAVLAGGVVAAPVGLLLSFLGLLVMYLGLFFFLLLGLMVGAFMYRVAGAGACVSKPALVCGGLAVALLTYFISLFLESRRLADHVANSFQYPTVSAGQPVTPANVEEVRARMASQKQQVRDRVWQMLAGRCPPGGFLGYVRWAATDGKLELEVPFAERPIKYRLSQSPLGFKLRFSLCLVLLCAGVLAQVWPLRRAGVSVAEVRAESAASTRPSAIPPTSAS